MGNYLWKSLIAVVLLALLISGCTSQQIQPATKVSPTSSPDGTFTSNPPAEILAREGYKYPSIPRIICEELKHLMDSGADFILIDVRDEAKFVKEHLKGAIDIPYRGANNETTSKKLLALPDNKLKIFYCD